MKKKDTEKDTDTDTPKTKAKVKEKQVYKKRELKRPREIPSWSEDPVAYRRWYMSEYTKLKDVKKRIDKTQKVYREKTIDQYREYQRNYHREWYKDNKARIKSYSSPENKAKFEEAEYNKIKKILKLPQNMFRKKLKKPDPDIT